MGRTDEDSKSIKERTIYGGSTSEDVSIRACTAILQCAFGAGDVRCGVAVEHVAQSLLAKESKKEEKGGRPTGSWISMSCALQHACVWVHMGAEFKTKRSQNMK